MTERDLKVLQFLTNVRAASTRQIQESFFSGLNPSVSYNRLKYLTDNKFVKRKYMHLDPNSNTHIYYLDKCPPKKTLRHELLITQFYVELKKLNYEILSFEKTPIYKGFRPDAVVEFKTDKEQVKKVFLEVQLSKHSVYEKYYNINTSNDPDIPRYLWVVTDQPQQQHSIRNLRIIIDDLKMTKLKNYF
jgi:DNA-binding Lrp family transcriptional regulator